MTQAVRRSLVLLVAAERSELWPAALHPPSPRYVDLTALLSQAARASLFLEINLLINSLLKLSFLLLRIALRCDRVQLRDFAYFKSLSICSDLFCVCVRCRARFLSLCALSLSFFLSLSPSLPFVSWGGERSPLADHRARREHHTLPQSHDVLQL